MNSKLIVALDVDSYEQATTLVHDLAGVVDVFKVGSQLFKRVGPKIVEFIHESGKKIFLDLKFHDIPNTVAKAIESAAALRVFMVSVHVRGGAEMLPAAARPILDRPLLLGVTILTSVAGDQKRVMTPDEAVTAGASYIVVDRPIIAAPQPVAVALRITTEMASADR